MRPFAHSLPLAWICLPCLLTVALLSCGSDHGAEAYANRSETPARGATVPATDSGAAATAMSTGRKTARGMVSWAVDDTVGALVNLGDILSARGMSIGLVSTVPFSHATPACFVAHSPSRHHYYMERSEDRHAERGIAGEMLSSRSASLIIGGGHPSWDNPGWSTDEGYISREWYSRLLGGEPDIAFVERTISMDGAELLEEACSMDPDSGIRVVGLFGGEDGCFEPPVPTDDGSGRVNPVTEENPTLAEAAVAALRYLARDDEGFLMVLEQGDIDWANHDNDFRWLLGSMWDLEGAVIAVTAFVDSSPLMDWDDTMVILTSDHSNGYMRLSSEGSLVRGRLPAQVFDSGDFTYPGGELGYSTRGHTNELVTFRARFPERMEPLLDSLEGSPPAPGGRLLDNTHIFHLIESASSMESPVPHVVLIIGDGMDPEHERAAGLYLYGAEDGLVWMDDTVFPYSTYCTTWNVETYDQYAAAAGTGLFSETNYDPLIGYDPSIGGLLPGEGSRDYFLTPLPVPDRSCRR